MRSQTVQDRPLLPVELLIESFIDRLQTVYKRKSFKIGADVMKVFMDYDWPGNVRELENIIERAYIAEKPPRLTVKSLSFGKLSYLLNHNRAIPAIALTTMTLNQARDQALSRVEQDYIVALMTANCGKIKDSAKAAGVTPRQIHSLLAKYQINKEIFR